MRGRSERGPVREIVVVEDRAALNYVVRQNVVLIGREVHFLQFLEGGNRFCVCRVKSGRLFDCRNGIAVFVFKMTENKPLSVRSRIIEFDCESSERNVYNRFFGVSVGEFSVARIQDQLIHLGGGFVNRIISRFYRIDNFFKLAWRNYLIAVARSPPDKPHPLASGDFVECDLFARNAVIGDFNAAVGEGFYTRKVAAVVLSI